MSRRAAHANGHRPSCLRSRSPRLGGARNAPAALFLVALLTPGLVSPHGEEDDGHNLWEQQADALAGSVSAEALAGLEAFAASNDRPGGEEVPHSHPHEDAGSSTGLRGGSIPHILIIYHSETKHTEWLANIILNGALDLIPSCHTEVLPVHKANHSVLTDWADVLVLGSPVIHAKPAPEILSYLERITQSMRPALTKVKGAVFTTSAGIGGGQELVIAALNEALQEVGIEPLKFPDCRYQLGLNAVTGFPPFCREGEQHGCQVESDAPPGQIHSKFETYGYEYGRQLVKIMADPNAKGAY